MKKLQDLFLIVFLAAIVLTSPIGCGGDSSTTPTDEQLNEFAEFLIEGAEFFVPESACPQSCAELQTNAQGVTVSCEGSGTTNLSVGACDSADKFAITAEFDNCSNDEGDSGSGTITITITVAANGDLTIEVIADNFTLNGISYSGTFTITVPCSGGSYGTASCSGSASSGGQSCTISSDCSTCSS